MPLDKATVDKCIAIVEADPECVSRIDSMLRFVFLLQCAPGVDLRTEFVSVGGIRNFGYALVNGVAKAYLSFSAFLHEAPGALTDSVVDYAIKNAVPGLVVVNAMGNGSSPLDSVGQGYAVQRLAGEVSPWQRELASNRDGSYWDLFTVRWNTTNARLQAALPPPFDPNNPQSVAYRDICTGIAEAAVAALTKRAAEIPGVASFIQESRDESFAHAAVGLKMTAGGHYVLDWWVTLETDDPLVCLYEDWNNARLGRSVTAASFHGFP